MSDLILKQQIFGLFEVDLAGAVLYSRVQPDGNGVSGADLAGKNFYTELASFTSIQEFRNKLDRFLSGTSIADSFQLTISNKNESFPVKVLLARIRERSNPSRTKSVMVHIKKA